MPWSSMSPIFRLLSSASSSSSAFPTAQCEESFGVFLDFSFSSVPKDL